MYVFSVITISLAVIYSANAITCPRCTDETDLSSCTGTQNCQGHDVCEFRVETGKNHKYTYHCSHSQGCSGQETTNCDFTNHGHCIFCCDSVDSCRTQRDNLFPIV